MDYQAFKYQLEKGKLKHVYLFSGPEIGDKKEALRILKQRIFSEDETNISSFYCDTDFSPADFIDAVQTQGLFSSTKLILLKNIEQAKEPVIKTLTSILIPDSMDQENYEKTFPQSGTPSKSLTDYYEQKGDRYFLKKIKEADKKKIIELFNKENFNPLGNGTFLILINETTEKIPESVTRLIPDSQIILFFEMFESKKLEWVRNEFKKSEIKIEEETIQFLLDMVENNKSELEREIHNISIYVKESSKMPSNLLVVTKSLIEDYLCHSKEETPFSLFSAMIQLDLSRALDILEKLFSLGPSNILAGLIWSQRRLIRILDLYENRKMPKEMIFKEMYITGKKVTQELSAVFNRFDFRHAVNALNRLSELEYYLRILPPSLKLVKLQEFILDYVGDRIDKSFLQGELQFLQS